MGSKIFLLAGGGNTYTWYPDTSLNNGTLPNPRSQAILNTQYFVTGTSVAGCSSTDSMWVFVRPVTLDSIVHLMCNEDSVFVGGNYQTTPGFYTDELASIYGCDSTVVTEVILTGPCPFPAPQVYVDKDATGLNNGTSWANAFTDLQDALAAVEYYPDVSEIWIAEGMYYPSAADRSSTFTFRDSVTLYGGFLGFETERGERVADPALVVLSGDIGVPSDSTDNAFHVITIDSTCAACVLDGLTVSFGQADGMQSGESMGAGLLVKGTARLEDLIIERNTTLLEGAAIYNSGIHAILTIRDCLFRLNTSGMERDILNSNGAEIYFEGMNTVER